MKIASLQTKLGEITVEESGYTEEGYPGFVVSLLYNNRELASVLFEVDETENVPECKVHVWDTATEEPICSFRGSKSEDNEMVFEMT